MPLYYCFRRVTLRKAKTAVRIAVRAALLTGHPSKSQQSSTLTQKNKGPLRIYSTLVYPQNSWFSIQKDYLRILCNPKPHLSMIEIGTLGCRCITYA